ncbi:hypothetical protein EB796_024961 [Bugula neritina]|uniref:Uncharacterized protein n=1 Tax=Bugula neritina TaxID=10212 RepID=A0A7J7IS08_BUGNE|nr:hypothetical protein EB796_024961 [Bugula neritina]
MCIVFGVAEVKEHYEVGDGHVVVPFVRLINIHTKKDVCPVLYLPPIYDSNVYVTPIVKDCQVEKESSTLVFHLKTSAKTIGYVVLKNKLKELQRIQIPPKTFVDKKVEVSYNSETLRGCIDVCASLITVNGLSSKPATKLWFNGQRLQKPGNAAPVTMAVPQQVSHTTAVSTHPVEVNEVEVDVEEGDLEADGTRTNAMAVHSEDVKVSCDINSWTIGDGVVTHGVHPNQDSGASDADIVSIAIAEAGIADDFKNCALYEKPVSSDLSLTEEINPRLCAVSTNPVDEDDGQLSLPGSAKEVGDQHPTQVEDAQKTKYELSYIALASDEPGEEEPYSCDSEGMQVSNLPTGFKNQLIPLAGSTLHSDPLLSQGSLAKLSLPLSPGLHHDIVWRNENCTNLPPGEELKQYGLTEATNDVDVTNEHPVSGNYTQQEVPSSMLDGSPAGQSLESGYLEDEFLDHPAYSEIIQKVSAGGVMMDEIYDGLEGFLDLDDDADTPNAAVETYGEVSVSITMIGCRSVFTCLGSPAVQYLESGYLEVSVGYIYYILSL